MDSRLRHDLSDPIAMVSMIASTIRDFSGSLDSQKLRSLESQVTSEMERARALVEEHASEMDLNELEARIDAFLESASHSSADRLQEECKRLIDYIESVGHANQA